MESLFWRLRPEVPLARWYVCLCMCVCVWQCGAAVSWRSSNLCPEVSWCGSRHVVHSDRSQRVSAGMGGFREGLPADPGEVHRLSVSGSARRTAARAGLANCQGRVGGFQAGEGSALLGYRSHIYILYYYYSYTQILLYSSSFLRHYFAFKYKLLLKLLHTCLMFICLFFALLYLILYCVF